MTTQETLREIEELQRRCEDYDGISLKLNWNSLRSEPGSGGAVWFYTYEEGLLAGFIGLYSFGSEVEVCGMVRPGYRRRGIFTSLWEQAHKQIIRKKAKSILLNAPAASKSAAGFLKTLPLELNHAEYQMKWDHKKAEERSAFENKILPDDMVILRPARADEKRLLAVLDSKGFNTSLEEAVEMYDELDGESSNEHIIIELDGQPVGKMRLWTEHHETWIYAFTVDEKMRGRGIGRSALIQTILRERRSGNGINLEVALDNPNALGLYESCGFVITNKQDYYRYIG
ncbi:Ribosomal protein S18 acetylase RimI [Paenibacillus sophorae]|uniref:GNAT family N-acetyltransferase n=1 Tax=Paenibacillus sophorae TaxID=1333845 RepID=A0A1H8NLS7_9BACL|nr:GNAT family N-acetyltransferase [Paenibacillus sophorae]QWU14554.1 GNAT family N-acetyltransferase [Paenibacillus sophorae]SEO30574.1 Ribosomal protein S18 acetylase RimI [Paenibacillus sophorae]